MKTNLRHIATAYVGSATAFAIAGEGATWLGQHWHWLDRPSYLVAPVLALTLPAFAAGFHLAGRLVKLTEKPTHPAQYYQYGRTATLASSAVWSIGGKAPDHTWGAEHPEEASRTIRLGKAPDRFEFVFWEEGMQSQISESRLYDFLKIAWRRQQHVHFGNLRSNQILSRAYFTKQARPRYPLPDYWSIKHILASRRLILNGYKGGELFYPPGITLDEAKRRWQPN